MSAIARTVVTRSLPPKGIRPRRLGNFKKGLNRSRKTQRLNTIIMKTLTSLLIGCSLALAGAALAQQPVEQQSPSKGKHAPEKARTTEAQPGVNAAKHQEKPAKQTGAIKQRGVTNERSTSNEPGAEKGRKTHVGDESANARETNAAAKSTGETRNEARTEKGRKARERGESANTSATETNVSGHAAGMPMHREKQQVEERKQGVKHPAGTVANAGSSVPTADQQKAQANAGAKAKKPEPQQVQQVKSQHANFRAQPKPQQVPPVTFNQNHHIRNSDHWQGQQYEVFRSYHPQWHDQGWYRSHYTRVELIGGGYYFFNNGYWYPAWGYNASAQYYPYDGPIYVGQSRRTARPGDR